MEFCTGVFNEKFEQVALRGGAWCVPNEEAFRSASRSPFPKYDVPNGLGFRVVKVLDSMRG